MKNICCTLLFFLLAQTAQAITRHIGNGQTYATLDAAAAQPGDTLLMHAGIYPGGLVIENLKGNDNQWITIKSKAEEIVILEGGNNAIQFIEPAYLHVLRLIFQ